MYREPMSKIGPGIRRCKAEIAKLEKELSGKGHAEEHGQERSYVQGTKNPRTPTLVAKLLKNARHHLALWEADKAYYLKKYPNAKF